MGVGEEVPDRPVTPERHIVPLPRAIVDPKTGKRFQLVRTGPMPTQEEIQAVAGLVGQPGATLPDDWDLEEAPGLRERAKQTFQEASGSLTGTVESALGTVFPKGPSRFLATGIVPQTPGQAGAALALTLAPFVAAPGGALARIAQATLGGMAGGAIAEGSGPVEGAVKGGFEALAGAGLSEGMGTLSRRLGGWAGQGPVNRMDTIRVGRALQDVSPDLGVPEGYRPVLDPLRSRAGAQEKLQRHYQTYQVDRAASRIYENALTAVEQLGGGKRINSAALDEAVKKTGVVTLPQPVQIFNAQGQVQPISTYTIREAFDALDSLRAGTHRADGTTIPGLKAQELRRLRAELYDDIRRQLPKAAAETAIEAKEAYGAVKAIDRLMNSKGVLDEGLNMRALQDAFVANQGDLETQLSRDGFKRVKDAIFRGRPSTERDIEAGHLGGLPARIYGGGTSSTPTRTGMAIPKPPYFVGEPLLHGIPGASARIPQRFLDQWATGSLGPRVGGGVQMGVEQLGDLLDQGMLMLPEPQIRPMGE